LTTNAAVEVQVIKLPVAAVADTVVVAIGADNALLISIMFATVMPFNVPVINPVAVVTVTGAPPDCNDITNVAESII
jgi:hypothetical protein